MKTYTLKSVARRGSMLGAAFVIAAASFLPASLASADALNPLTERSLTLSSGSPGWNFRDASGNATYAPPNSGPNGQKTGNTFSFRVSSNASIKGLDFQYCTTPAGDCKGPGDNGYSAGDPLLDTGVRKTNAEALATNDKTSDLQVVGTGSEIDNAFFLSNFTASTGQPSSTGVNNYDPDTIHPNMPALDGSDGTFIVLYKNNLGDNWTQSEGWAMDTEVRQTMNGDGTTATQSNGKSTNKENYITLVNAAGTPVLPVGGYVKVIFFATDDTYITNPGSKEFFVKINTFNTEDPLLFDISETSTTRIDGGVTVANVMNRSIEIQTKVLETMQFSVGTVDPNTLSTAQLTAATGETTHTPCDPIAQGMSTSTVTPNVLQLGDEAGEFSLRTDTTYSTHSYWRLSSNSSGGATVYYAGTTLSNTVGDQINPIGKTASVPTKGGEQFGLALDNNVNGAQYEVSYARERVGPDHLFQNGADNDATVGVDASTTTDVGANLSWHTPRLYPLVPEANYDKGTGVVNIVGTNPFAYADNTSAAYAEFAFDPDSNVIPTPIANGTEVLDCVTGKMRYIANIAATTPAGIYTTKINYIAAPKY